MQTEYFRPSVWERFKNRLKHRDQHSFQLESRIDFDEIGATSAFRSSDATHGKNRFEWGSVQYVAVYKQD